MTTMRLESTELYFEDYEVASSYLGVSISLISDLFMPSRKRESIKSHTVRICKNFVLVSIFKKKPSCKHLTWQV